MTAPILVTGGTGTLGKHVVARLRSAGHEVRILNRANGDLTTGEGVAKAVAGIETIIHCAGTQKGDGEKTRNLVTAARDAKHLVFISVVGADRVPVRSRVDRAMFGYFAAHYGLPVVGSVIPSLSTAAQPSAQELAALIQRIRQQHVRASTQVDGRELEHEAVLRPCVVGEP